LYSSPDASGAAGDPTAKRRKYERLGWSRAKIERALAASEEAHSETTRPSGIRQDVAKAIADIARSVGEIRLLVHQYPGLFAEEKIVVQSTHRLHASEFEKSAHASVAEDIVYTIVAQNAA
jgi:hypothetical protein